MGNEKVLSRQIYIPGHAKLNFTYSSLNQKGATIPALSVSITKGISGENTYLHDTEQTFVIGPKYISTFVQVLFGFKKSIKIESSNGAMEIFYQNASQLTFKAGNGQNDVFCYVFLNALHDVKIFSLYRLIEFWTRDIPEASMSVTDALNVLKITACQEKSN